MTRLLFAGLFLLLSSPSSAGEPTQFKLTIRVVHAVTQGSGVDPALKDLTTDLQQLNFGGFTLLDRHSKVAYDREVIALEFPGSRWLELRTKGQTKKGDLKLKLNIRDLGFKAKATVGDGRTIIVGGPPHKGGRILLAVTAQRR